LADLADGTARAVVNDGSADGCVFAAVALVDILNDLLAPLVLEVDVDVGWLAALLGKKAGKEKVAGCGIDLRNAEAKADGAIGGGAATLAEDIPLACLL